MYDINQKHRVDFGISNSHLELEHTHWPPKGTESDEAHPLGAKRPLITGIQITLT